MHFGSVFELGFKHAGQFAVALGDVQVPHRFAQDHARQTGETHVDTERLVEALVGRLLVFVWKLFRAGQVHETDGALDGLLFSLQFLHHVRETVFDQFDVESEHGVGAAGVFVGVVGRCFPLLETPVQHVLHVQGTRQGNQGFVADGGGTREVCLHLVFVVFLGHVAQVQLD